MQNIICYFFHTSIIFQPFYNKQPPNKLCIYLFIVNVLNFLESKKNLDIGLIFFVQTIISYLFLYCKHP